MRSHKRGSGEAGKLGSNFWGILLLLMGVGACSGIAAPRGAVPMVTDAPRDAFGGWAGVWEGKGYSPTFEGELIAIDRDSVFVLVGDTLRGRALSGVRRVRVVGYDPKAGDLQTWTFVGALSTASHGIVSIISAPLWLILGSSITGSAAHASEFNAPGIHRSWNGLKPYARFPQGLPPDLDRQALKPRR